MKIRPKEIPIYLEGGAVPLWYLDRYGNRTSLLGWNRNKRYDYSDENLNANGHRNAGTLVTAYNKNLAYIGTPAVVSSDILAFYNSDGNGMSALDFVNFYNKNAEAIRSHWALDQTYGASTAGDHNRLYRKMFQSRSDLSLSPGSIYNIGYLTNLENTEGSSTWLRRMDLYENEFDEKNPDTNRIHEITLKDGSKAKVYKKANGDIALLNDSLNGAPSETGPVMPSLVLAKDLDSFKPKLQQLNGSIQVLQRQDPESKWKIFGDRLKSAAPDILDALRLAGNLHNNERVYNAVLKGIRPNLQQTYNTYRQVVGDEATKQAYYRRGIAGQTKAGLAFTSDADRLMAYQMEAKRAADESKAQGDLVNNAEIRRTSDESNQHAWGNVQRATEVANRNLIEMNNANAAKWNLKALKYSADWTNWDNYLMGIQNRWQQKKEEDKAFLRQLATLDMQEDLLSNKTLTDLRLLRDKAYNDYITAKDGSPEKKAAELKVTELSRQLQLALIQAQRDVLGKYRILGAKSGSKLEYVRDDKYLYKTSKDIVEHFRAMSKMSDESRLKSRTRPIKLSSHPKGNTRKYQLGGVAPFTIYRPLGIGGESAISSQTTSSGTSSKTSSTKDEAAKNKLDLVKELFKSLQGLPVDVNTAYSDIYKLFEKSKLFGEEMSTDDIAGIYLNSIRSVNLLKHSLEVFEKAKDFATSLDSLQEYAVTANGHYIALDKEGNLTEVKDLKEFADNGLSPVTNQLLINMRAYSANMVGLKGDTILENIIGNGMGVNKIGEFIKSMASKIGTSETKLEGISQVEAGKVKAGLEILAGAPDGYYKITKENKTLLAQVNAALSYIENMLSPSLRAILNAHGGTRPLIQSFLTSQLSATENISIQPLTGKASDKEGKTKDDSEGLKLDAATALISGKGYLGAIEFNPGTSYAVIVNARHSGFLKKSGENMGSGITMLEATTSTLDKVLDWNKATLGGSRLNPTGYNRIMINSDDVVGVDLPVGSDKNTPDFTMLLKLQVLDLELLKKGIEDTPNNWKQVNQICLEIGLPAKYKNDGSLNEYSWNRFAAFQVTADDSVLVDKNAILSDILGVVEDDNVREQYELIILKNNKNYKLGSGFLGLGKQALYLGTVFVPINSNYVASALSGGLNISMLQATNLELRERGYDLLKIATYKPGININEL